MSSENIKELIKKQLEDKTNEVTEEMRKLNIQIKQLKRKKEDYENELKQRKTEEKEEKRKCLKNKLTA